MALVSPPATAEGRVDLLLAVAQGVDVVILGAMAASPLPGVCSHLLGEYPNLKILVVTETGSCVLYWMGRQHRRFGRVSADRLLQGVLRAHTRDMRPNVARRS